ncbi:NAD(P)-dependent oxidoreductase [Gynuella sunshinyii]|uniref:3-hydroxyisobutyrate dehydrogenase and related beta-hydroxyacid dehydrogenase n=1 Tax=Gynuella sunshinyii YC6258 TaxID=1445510 RepID=A0A0C5VKV8_9GAMM|nr:NAD(P)-dependent oxidoreductase [Gynuella sunshinyii]AJQ94941.1 3-hydroxyisobutyrate dehydrogenase and related beta-hydroxyacid dehydrogenase [Gynuella sunshinyii YC6258]
MKVSFIGLGVMGYPMAGHLAEKGHEVTVYNRTVSKSHCWVEQYSGGYAATPAQAVIDADQVFMCVGNDDDVRSVVYGEHGVLAGMKPGAILVDHTTTSAVLAEELNQAANEKQLRFLDGPVSGGQAGAENGVLTVMMGGEPADFSAVEGTIKSYAKKVTLLGAAGSGQRCKMVNQLCIAGIVQGLSEAIKFAQHAELDIKTVVEVLSGGAAQSWQLDNRALTMAEGKFDFGFAIDWMRKDLGFCFEEAEKMGLKLPLARMVDGFYQQLQQQGDNRLDTSSLIKLL